MNGLIILISKPISSKVFQLGTFWMCLSGMTREDFFLSWQLIYACKSLFLKVSLTLSPQCLIINQVGNISNTNVCGTICGTVHSNNRSVVVAWFRCAWGFAHFNRYTLYLENEDVQWDFRCKIPEQLKCQLNTYHFLAFHISSSKFTQWVGSRHAILGINPRPSWWDL